MYAFCVVDDLGDAEVHCQARQGHGPVTVQTKQLTHKVQHRIDGAERRLVEISVKAEREPPGLGKRPRRL